ncbi:MAG: cytidylate kinase-like family protein, partial [Desulfobacterales bacterium]|nr:cytidylate kinase-like family protein [Desulfobacterales bacterium]
FTISRQFGAGGKTLGSMVAKTLEYTFADSSIIQMISKQANVSAKWVKSFEKEAGGVMSRAISSIVSQRMVDRILKDERGYLDEKIYLDYLVLTIVQMADEGNAVILGRGSQYILKEHPDVFHVLLIDDMENRVKFVMDHYNYSRNRAARLVNGEDKRRANLYKKLGKYDYDDPSLYHLVLNMGLFDLQTTHDLLCNLISK